MTMTITFPGLRFDDTVEKLFYIIKFFLKKKMNALPGKFVVFFSLCKKGGESVECGGVENKN